MLRRNSQLGLAVPPQVLQLKVGDTLRVTNSFTYSGPAISGKLHTAMWVWSWFDPHNEILFAEKSFNLPNTPTAKDYPVNVDIYIKSGTDLRLYGLYTKIIGIPGADIFSPFYENVIEIVAAVPVGITFQMGVAGTPSGWEGYDRWMCYYFDPGINGFVSDQQWHRVDEYVTFSNVQTGGYPAAFVMRSSDPSKCSPQYTGGPFWSEEGRKYIFNIVELKVYVVA